MKIILSTILATIFITGCSYKSTEITTEEYVGITPQMLEKLYSNETPRLVDRKIINKTVVDYKDIKTCPEYTIIDQKSESTEKNAYVKNILVIYDENTKKKQYSEEEGDLVSTQAIHLRICKHKNQNMEINTVSTVKDTLK